MKRFREYDSRTVVILIVRPKGEDIVPFLHRLHHVKTRMIQHQQNVNLPIVSKFPSLSILKTKQQKRDETTPGPIQTEETGLFYYAEDEKIWQKMAKKKEFILTWDRELDIPVDTPRTPKKNSTPRTPKKNSTPRTPKKTPRKKIVLFDPTQKHGYPKIGTQSILSSGYNAIVAIDEAALGDGMKVFDPKYNVKVIGMGTQPEVNVECICIEESDDDGLVELLFLDEIVYIKQQPEPPAKTATNSSTVFKEQSQLFHEFLTKEYVQSHLWDTLSPLLENLTIAIQKQTEGQILTTQQKIMIRNPLHYLSKELGRAAR